MQIVKRKARPAVTEVVVVSEAIPESYDLLCLTPEQMALLAILLGCAVHSVKGDMYSNIIGALNVHNDVVYNITEGKSGLPKVDAQRVSNQHISHLLNSR